MAERYVRINSLGKYLYEEGSPVIIAAGALLMDNYTKAVLAQLKFKNISDKKISSLTVSITPLDVNGEAKWESVEYKYQELNALRDEQFGQKAAVVMPDTQVRAFSAAVKEVIFDDATAWLCDSPVWSSVKLPRHLDEALGSPELTAQFTARYGADCTTIPDEDKDLWYCTCGAINKDSEPKCHSCRRVHSALKSININSFKSESAQRIEMEKQQEEEEIAEKKRISKKIKLLLAVIIPAALVIALVLAIVPVRIAKEKDYSAAEVLLSQGKYDQAQSAFIALGNYGDSKEQAEKNVPYQKAMYIMECAKNGDTDGLVLLGMKRSEIPEDESVSIALYRKADEMFEALSGYKASDDQRKIAQAAITSFYDAKLKASYDRAEQLLKEGKFCEARDAFIALDDYSDSATMATECIYQKGRGMYNLLDKYSLEGVYAKLSDVTGEKSVFYISEKTFKKLGSGFVSEIKDVCRGDGVEINFEAAPEGYLPICDEISAFFDKLGDYKDSKDLSANAKEAGDFTKPFFQYVENGDVLEAYQWLTQYDGELPNRDVWLSTLQLYAPYCGNWQFLVGDQTLIPLTIGVDEVCTNLVTKVVIDMEVPSVTLHIYVNGSPDLDIPLAGDFGSNANFKASPGGNYTYIAAATMNGTITYSRYNNYNPKDIHYSCEYQKVE